MRDESAGFSAWGKSQHRREKRGLGGRDADHEAQVTPLIEEITVDVDAIWLAQVFCDQRAYGGEISRFQAVVILDILQVPREADDFGHVHDVRWRGLTGEELRPGK